MDIPTSYIARCKCGCGGLVFATVDDPSFRKDTAKEVAVMIQDGYIIERMIIEGVRKAAWGCQKGSTKTE